jgi:hypothetical protein
VNRTEVFVGGGLGRREGKFLVGVEHFGPEQLVIFDHGVRFPLLLAESHRGEPGNAALIPQIRQKNKFDGSRNKT